MKTCLLIIFTFTFVLIQANELETLYPDDVIESDRETIDNAYRFEQDQSEFDMLNKSDFAEENYESEENFFLIDQGIKHVFIPDKLSPNRNFKRRPAAFITQHNKRIKTYHVKEHESLKLISFKIYGTPKKWKDLYRLNKFNLGDKIFVDKGVEIKYQVPSKLFEWKVSGTPYKIKKGDTLKSISQKFYSTPKRWFDIWKNNRPVMEHPKKLLEGFTIYIPTPYVGETKHLSTN